MRDRYRVLYRGGEGETVEKQFPEEGEKIIVGTKVILYTE